MSLYQQSLRTEELPIRLPSELGLGVPVLRARAIITVQDGHGFRHEAELAPFPGVHPETLDQALRVWQQQIEPMLPRVRFDARLWRWDQAWFGLLAQPACALSSVQTAVEQLLLSVAQRIMFDIFPPIVVKRLQGSALLLLSGSQQQASQWQDFLQLWQLGFRVFKCKINPQAAEEQIKFLLRMRAFGQEQLQLRLDANQRLLAVDQKLWLQAIPQLAVNYWEEPGSQMSAQLQPQALDESLWDRLAGEVPNQAEVWILKPNRFGLTGLVAWLREAEQQGRRAVLSNAYESGLSLRCYAWLYAQFCLNPEALGFGTTRYLAADHWQSQTWGDPWIDIPGLPFA